MNATLTRRPSIAPAGGQAPQPVRAVDIINLSSSAHTLLKERVLAMRQAGVDNRILCIDGPYVSSLREQGIPVETVHLPRGYDPVKIVRSTLEIASYLRRERVDLVHTHCSVPGFIGRIAAAMAGVPAVIHTVHGFHFHDKSRGPKRTFYVSLERFAGLFTDSLLSQNRADLEQAKRYRVVSPERMGYIGNGIQLQHFRAADTRSSRDGVATLTCVARMEKVKNHRLLFEAVRILARRGDEFRVWLIGDGELKADYQRLCREWQIQDRVQFLGYREDIPELLSQSQIAVLTSEKEGIPRAILEAMASSLPVVATRVNGTREVVRNGETGFLVEPGDSQGLADALSRLIHDPELRVRLGREARAVAEREYDENTIIDSLRGVYRSALLKKGIAMGPALTAAVER